MGSHRDKSHFFAEHLHSEDLNFIHLNILWGVINFRYIVFKLFAIFYFLQDFPLYMLVREHLYDSFFYAYLKSLYHRISNFIKKLFKSDYI